MTRDELNTHFDNLLKTSLGKPVKVLPNKLPPQCFDWVVRWTNTLGVPHYPGNPSPFPYKHAYQIYANFGEFQAKYFDRIATKTFLKGDIVVFGTSVGPDGHVAIAKNSWVTTDQNWNGRGYITEESHNLSNVLGVLRLKVTKSPMNDRRPYWFDRMNSVTFKKGHEKVTDAEVEKFVSDYPGQLKRSGLLDQIARAHGFQGDTNALTYEDLMLLIRKHYDPASIRKRTIEDCVATLKNLT